MNQLAKLDKARQMLAEARTLDEVKKIKAIAEAAKVYARAQKLGLDAKNYAGEIIILASRKAGEILIQIERHQGELNFAAKLSLTPYNQMLSDSDISPKAARQWQDIAELSDEVVAEYVTKTQNAKKELSMEGLLKTPAARARKRKKKKEKYNNTVAKNKPKKLEGTYRIIYADPPWKYVGLNQADEYGHAERHYDCLDDEQLKNYRIGGRLIRDMVDKNSVLFLWVTAPIRNANRHVAIIDSWGFEGKADFVWDKVKHNVGHYNSVRHEYLLVCTRGSCMPDVPKLVDSVQSIERSNKHSEKPEEFRKIIENLYDHGRKLELFRRGKAPEGWDIDGNEAE